MWEQGALQLEGTAGKYQDGKQMSLLYKRLEQTKWVVRSKAPFAGVRQVVEYLARYTHRIAITDNRILEIREGKVRFRYKVYQKAEEGQAVPQEEMEMEVMKFLRRFSLHILPPGFQKIRYYGLFASAAGKKLEKCRQLLGNRLLCVTVRTVRQILMSILGFDPHYCPACQSDRITTNMTTAGRRWNYPAWVYAYGRAPPDRIPPSCRDTSRQSDPWLRA